MLERNTSETELSHRSAEVHTEYFNGIETSTLCETHTGQARHDVIATAYVNILTLKHEQWELKCSRSPSSTRVRNLSVLGDPKTTHLSTSEFETHPNAPQETVEIADSLSVPECSASRFADSTSIFHSFIHIAPCAPLGWEFVRELATALIDQATETTDQ